MDEQFLARMDCELAGASDPLERLRRALEQNDFELYCQPILQFAGEVRYPMAEVLVRMREEERALLPPGEFLPIFEHYRMMPQLDRWVVRNTIKRLARGSRVRRFTINMSLQTLEDAEFPRFVAAQLSSNKVSADALAFEIDEGDILARPQVVAQFAAACRASGVMLIIDGFGRRSLSFAPLKALAAHFVKVDGSVTRKVVMSEVARTKLNAMLRVGEALGFQLVAECVEDEDVLARLKTMGVGYAQGFGIYKPLPIDALTGA